MNGRELKREILEELGFAPTADQAYATDCFVEFLTMDKVETVLLLCGSAGTGKTSLAAAMVRALSRMGRRMVLLAPTGRAAKVFSLNAGLAAHTIHHAIYRQRSFEGLDTAFRLAENKHSNTLFIVDEASMISNQSTTSAGLFGSGCLLDDLVQYVYSGSNCRLILIGDKAQLPPVGLTTSPALDRAMLEKYGLEVLTANLDEVLRQSHDSGILHNATTIRRQTSLPAAALTIPRIRLKGFSDVRVVRGDELIESLCSSYSEATLDGTMVVTRSNKTANIYNQGIRNMILGREEELCAGDRLMVVKNNYYWTARLQKEASHATSDDGDEGATAAEGATSIPSFLANGDVAIVRKVSDKVEEYGFRFADVVLEFPDYDAFTIDVKIILNSLSSEAPSLSYDEQQHLFAAVMEDYAHIRSRRQRMNAVREDMFYNALQVKFAYAVTCHKAQGGQWEHVYIDQGYMTDDMLSNDYIHWLYTAFTRATQCLFLVNWPVQQQDTTN